MPRYDFDMFTIGAGSGGVASSRRAGAYGARVAICEELRVGGTCVLRGCVPKKLLVYGAQFADAFADAEVFGWCVPPAEFDWPKLIAAKDKEIGRLSQIYINMLNNAHVEILTGRGVVVDLVRRPEVLRGFDEDLRVYLGEEMRGRGIDIRGSTHVARIDKSGAAYVVTTTAGDRIDTDLVMYATGRAPNTEGLGLAEIG